MHSISLRGTIALLALLALAAQSACGEDAFESALDANIAAVVPKPAEEKWLKIPWRTDFAAARIEANQDGKPIFLWMMDGNPLGCT